MDRMRPVSSSSHGGFGSEAHTGNVASTGSLAVAVGSATAAITFAVVSVVGATSPRPDLGGPVIVELVTDVPEPGPAEDDENDSAPDEG